MKAAIDTSIPTIVASLRGAMENEVIPSTARANREKKFHDDFPAMRSPLSNSISFLRKPIQQNIPFV